MLSRFATLGKWGDTIVEVMLAIAIVSAVLGGAFISVNRSLRGTQQSQERGEAVKLVEGQLERLKEAANDPSKQIFTAASPNPFCLDDNLNRQAPCAQGTDNRYTISIQRVASGEATTFTARAVWDRLGGGQDQVVIVYRMYQQ